MHRERGAREQHQAHVGAAGGRAHDVLAVGDETAHHEPVGVRAAARERPAAADEEVLAVGQRAPARREHAADDLPVAVDLRGRLGLQVGGEHPAGPADGDDPCRRGVGAREGPDGVEEVLGRGLEPPERGGDEGAEQAGVPERRDDRLGEAPVRVAGRGVLGGEGGEGREVCCQAGHRRTLPPTGGRRCG